MRHVWLAVICVTSACFSPVGEVECTTDSDCAPAFFCVDRQCSLTKRDGGSVMTVDSGLPAPRTDWGNVAGELRGARLGSGTKPGVQLTRVLTVQRSGDDRFAVINATLTRHDAEGETGYLTARVKNVGATGACFVKVEPVVYVDANDSTVLDNGRTYVRGSSAKVNTVSTETCLLPGQEGFILGIVLDNEIRRFFSRTTGVRLNFAAATGDFTVPTSRFIPQSYLALGRTPRQSVTMTARNEGPVTIRLDDLFGMMVPLDEEGRGLGWFILDPITGEVRVPSGVTLNFDGSIGSDEGSATRAYGRTNTFEDCANCLRAPLDLSTHEGRAAFNRQLRDAEVERELRARP